MSYTAFSASLEKRLERLRFRGPMAVLLSAVLTFALSGLVVNAVAILRLPQSGLKLFEIVWVSLTACVVVVLLATAIAAALEHLGQALRPKPPSEEWLRDEVRHHRMAGIELPTTREAAAGGISVRSGKAPAA